MFKMKNNSQKGIGFLPVMIAVLLVAISAIGYNVYLNQEQLKKQVADRVEDEQTIDVNAPLSDVQQQVADRVEAILSKDSEVSTEQAESHLIFKDSSSGLLVQMTDENTSTRFMLTSESTERVVTETLQTVDSTLATYGFTYYSGLSPEMSISDTATVNVAYARGNDFCYVNGLKTNYLDVGCVTASQSDIKTTADVLKPYYDANKRNFEALYPNETYDGREVVSVNEQSRKTIDGLYETVSGSVGGLGEVNGYYEVLGGGRLFFYREVTGDWMVAPHSGNGGPGFCDAFNTDILRGVYSDVICYNPATKTDTTVAEYWQ